MSGFRDGLTNIVNKLANRRSAEAANYISATQIQPSQLRAIYRTGLGSKIVRIKAGYALNDTLQFDSDHDKRLYQKKLERHVKLAAKYMLGFGRGIILINEIGADHASPATGFNLARVKLDVFSGDMVTVSGASPDLSEALYNKPKFYSVNGVYFHHSRVVDLNYHMPAERDFPTYQYGGISEFELIHAQLVNDGIVERASATIVDKNSTMFHKVAGFKERIACGEDDALVEYYSKLADLRSIYGDGIIDAEDDVISVAQTLTNLADVDNITLRRLAMVTSIPLPILVGESVTGLNSTGAQERQSFQDMTEALQFDHLLEPIERLCMIYGIHDVQFKENQGGTASERLEYETKVIKNALDLLILGEDFRKYLDGHDVIKKDAWDQMFGEEDDEPAPAPQPQGRF